MKRLSTIAVLLLTALAAEAQLKPAEVLVVANSNSPESVELARLYVKLRQIPQQNLLLVKTTSDYQVSRSQYDAQLLLPLRAHLRKRENPDQIRCLALIYGVPVRVAGPEAPAGQVAAVYRDMLNQMQNRMALLLKLLDRVGVDMPESALQAEIDDLTGLFGKQSAPEAESMDQMRSRLPEKLQDARRRVGQLDPADRALGLKQLQAILFQVSGLEGLARLSTGQDAEAIEKRLDDLEQQVTTLILQPQTPERARQRIALQLQLRGIPRIWHDTLETLSAQSGDKADASVDSELALARIDIYDLPRWVANPMHHAARQDGPQPPVLMTARLDGPDDADVRRMIQASVQVEKTGLEGRFYIDAGGLPRARAYDANFKKLFNFLVSQTKLKVRMDEQLDVFQQNSCPDAALYVGWYSLKKYVPAFIWKPGAVGWHVASFEAQDLRNAASQTWCVKMIQNGVAATIGAVNEPYLAAFPLPQEFFALLLTGRYSLAECYWMTVPHASWRLTLIGDPLYRPFAAEPQLKPAQLPQDLKP